MLVFEIQGSLNYVQECMTMLVHRITPILFSGCLLLTGCDDMTDSMYAGFNHSLAEIWTEDNGLGEVRAFNGSVGSRKKLFVRNH